MKFWVYFGRVSLVCVCLLAGTAVLADDTTKAAKIAELAQLTAARQLLHDVDGKVDQEEAVRAWQRFYSDNVTETDLDAILAYYRSPAGQRDVSASRAALEQVQRTLHDKHRPPNTTPTAAATSTNVGSAPPAPRASNTASVSSPALAATNSGSATSPALASSATGRAKETPPGAPDGRVVPSPASPEQCEVAPTPPTGGHTSRSVVCVCTDERGSLTRDPVIAESSGDTRVDSGALKMARVDSGRYRPPTLDGHPQAACFRFAIDFSHLQ